MAKILVADDNSNIQKMVGLALKDQGIEVFAVGNGEAAVRKIADVRPDLVLADVFMPVRNGYEVCEFIKKNDKLSHIPVILLVGAFDPLDEQEAQRVGADGVLKKPFVPPDPLISMVKSALARAAAAARVPVSVGVPDQVPSSAAAPVISPFPTPAASEFANPEVSPEEEVSTRSQLSIDEGHPPLAFGSLLDAPAEEKEAEADASFLPASHAGLAEERKWNTPAEEEEGEEPEETPSWRSSIDELFDSPAGAANRAVSDWRDTVPSAPPQDAVPAVEASATVEAATPLEELPSPSASPLPESSSGPWQSEETPASVKAAPLEEPRSEAPAAEAVFPPASFTPENFPGLFVDEKTAAVPESRATTREPLVEQEFVPPTGAASNWEEEVRRAARLVTTWESAPEVPQPASPSNEFASRVSETSNAWSEPQPAAQISSSFEPTAGDTAAKLPDEAPWPGRPPTFGEPAPPAQFDPPDWYRKFEATPAREEQQEAAPVPQAAEPAPAPDMDALVAKVLEKMSPSVLQQVTRDILKPMVEALVRDELDKKK